MVSHSYFATCPAGLASLLAAELKALGARRLRTQPAGVHFNGDLELGYRCCLWLRTANRVLLRLANAPVEDRDSLYAAASSIDWREHVRIDGTLAVDFQGRCPGITHPHFGAQVVKDAIVDQLRAHSGQRPSVEATQPDLRVNAFIAGGTATLYVDLSGDSLHRRGYRLSAGAAPLKENLAAAMLLLADWPERARAGAPLLDPMCGSGTLVIEAALIAHDVAPGLGRTRFGFSRWLGHQTGVFERVHAEAVERARAPHLGGGIFGFDADADAIAQALNNAARAGCADHIRFECCPLEVARATLSSLQATAGAGVLATNPPYGERLLTSAAAASLYAQFATTLARDFVRWRACVLTPEDANADAVAQLATHSHHLHNGPIACHVHVFTLPEAVPVGPPEDASAFRNRLARNLAHIGRWARQQGIDCYRVYDRDVPEFAFAIDIYGGPEDRFVHVQEYAPPTTVDPARSAARASAVLSVLPEGLGVPATRVFSKVRKRMRDNEQYQKLADSGSYHEVREHGRRLLVNFTDHLDTGLFLDHRPTRQLIAQRAAGKDFLNLFCYTGAATVAAACGGATTTTSVDVSPTYLEWTQRNLEINGYSGAAHRCMRADCTEWLPRAARHERRYGLIFLDPPTFSHGKRVRDYFEVQRDHATLINAAARLLTADGLLLFSTNFRRFTLDREALPGLAIDDITKDSIALDFARNPRIHQCFALRRATS